MSFPQVTICVLLFGEYPHLAKKTIGSVLEHCNDSDYQLFVGCNACCDETLEYVNGLSQIDRLFVSEQNLNKCPMQRKMFAEIETEFVWWFDDDSYIIDPAALTTRLAYASRANPDHVLWGPTFVWESQEGFNLGVDVRPWIRAQAWYSGEPIPHDSTHNWFFVIGACWFARMSLIRELDWPPEEFLKPGDDALFCEAIRQKGYQYIGIGECGVEFQTEERRAPETKEMMLHQVGKFE